MVNPLNNLNFLNIENVSDQDSEISKTRLDILV